MSNTVLPTAVFVLWWIGLAITLVIFVPLSVYLLHRTWSASRSINHYAAEALVAAAGVAANTQYIPALDATITVGAAMIGVAGQIAAKLDTAATVLAERTQ